MSDDWRVSIEIDEANGPSLLLEKLHEAQLTRDLRQLAGLHLVVSHDGPTVFVYAENERDARVAAAAVGPLLDGRDLHGAVAIGHWDDAGAQWLDGDTQRPLDEGGDAAVTDDWADFEVRVTLPDHEATRELADRLKNEGIPTVRRWRYLLVGATSEAQADALAERLRQEAPAGADVRIEPGGRLVLAAAPFRFFASLGG